MENQNQVSHLFHRPLEISQTPRDFHIPTDPAACPLTNQNQERKSPLRGSVFPFFMTFAPSRRKTVFMLILRLENAATPSKSYRAVIVTEVTIFPTWI